MTKIERLQADIEEFINKGITVLTMSVKISAKYSPGDGQIVYRLGNNAWKGSLDEAFEGYLRRRGK